METKKFSLDLKKSHALIRNLMLCNHSFEESAYSTFISNKIGGCMDFKTMVNKLDKGTKAFRPTWGEGEALWKKDGILVHNTPYWGGELINQYLNGYPYVCEKQDVEATDWVVMKDESN